MNKEIEYLFIFGYQLILFSIYYIFPIDASTDF